jgi:hypothetical protein
MKARVALMAAMMVAGCVHTAPVPAPGAWVTSDSSQYSPVARFRAHTSLDPMAIHIAIDSGSLSVPGEVIPDSPPIMGPLFLTAILAVPDSGSMAIVNAAVGRAPAERRGWNRLASSDSVLLLTQLHYGERAPFKELQLVIPSGGVPAGPSWIIYKISGNAVEMIAPMVPGGSIQRRDHPGAVRVYACGDRDLRGTLDSARAASLRRVYGIAC